jgi:hypothetical protein
MNERLSDVTTQTVARILASSEVCKVIQQRQQSEQAGATTLYVVAPAAQSITGVLYALRIAYQIGGLSAGVYRPTNFIDNVIDGANAP